ncbi:ethyl tert-butyl ether degradation protein EthD [Bacillus sp. FJAT-27225]|uniref:EthD family reductase n=1 Tax=Bacillus sp. FJAT-27225 TaxID=1743144 RepID=UPI00080C34AB|nr:EthD family reductase [Bacillus sp. FJAT-27225]OCA90635.1 ethyl tert-butyl ether degradation protein EthD [Bacillus sp. FJAT-27225]
MIKMIALYKHPENKEAFDEYYFNTHIPLTEKIPGLKKCVATRMTGSPMGGETPYYMMAEMYYEDMASFKAAMKTDEAKASGKDAMKFAGDILTLMIGEEVNE